MVFHDFTITDHYCNFTVILISEVSANFCHEQRVRHFHLHDILVRNNDFSNLLKIKESKIYFSSRELAPQKKITHLKHYQ